MKKVIRKITSAALAAIMAASAASVCPVFAGETEKGAPTSFNIGDGLYVHAVTDSADTNAWQLWQSVHDEDFDIADSSEKYFFLPSSADSERVDVYNGFSDSVTLAGVTIASGATESVPYQRDKAYSVEAGGKTYSLKYLKSSAEAAIYINNPDADGNGTELSMYLEQDKNNRATATGAIVTPDGTVDNTAIKKIKGRGNTSWDKPKKGYNITYDKKVSIAGMDKSKKYSILANYQDDSLSRNRILYDLSDAVGMPYASDSRYVDFYINGFYWGSYQMCEKVEAGDLVYDVDEKGYLDAEGNLRSDFSFIAEVDASAGDDDYYFRAKNGSKVTLKAPEIEKGEPYYQEVLDYAKEKFDAFATATKNKSSDLGALADIDSLTKLFMINELGKNWDSGVSSTFFTYKPDENGAYKFYGSPVWDYDNSLGNANGVGGELNYSGVSDYTEYTGWWCQYKGKGKSERASSNNIINQLSIHKQIVAAAPGIWCKDFLPAIRHFSGDTYIPAIDRELKTAQEYYQLIAGSAEMNYASGWLLKTGSWIADHSSLKKAEFDTDTLTYSVSSSADSYSFNFEDMYRYACDWMISRSAWLTNEYKAGYVPYADENLGDVTGDGKVDISDVTLTQMNIAKLVDFDDAQNYNGDIDKNEKIDIGDVTLTQMYIANLPVSEYEKRPLG